ncbi:hypothetical protein GCK72_006775 [Caenorhabditis remanei]|uniref:G-protein coupled receptors family 1 profile domain-containing protein n=1 Tax=Caenorhabditis remanei TaxID=31234 RepID=A0A6A5HJN6_CAERE|nr:hypothetical protein GCK72_006775 [Caenorhabditis remanei]KAF1766817.1 hypothetical protein GCK72_006775 [Caenorhabditis remanei]
MENFQNCTILNGELNLSYIDTDTQLTSLSLVSLSLYDVLDGPFIMNLENLHSEFCLTFEEVQFFLENYVSFNKIHAKFCPGAESIMIDDMERRVCQFKNMKTLAKSCIFIYGTVVIDSGDEEYVYKLESLETIFGSIVIKNTKLVNLNFLEKLRFIASLEDGYVMEILSNHNMTTASFPDLGNIISRGNRYVVLNDNPLLITDDCMIFPITYQTNVAFIGNNCENSIANGHKSATIYFSVFIGIFVDFTGYFGEYDCRMPSSYSDIIVALIAGMFHDCCRRLSTWLAVLMALVRLLIIKNPLKSNMGFLSTPSFAIKTISVVFMFCFMITLLVFGQYELSDFGTYEIHFCEYLPSNYSVPYDWRLSTNLMFDDIRPKLEQTILFVDGTSKIIPAVILPILSILLIRCIQKAVKSRKSLSKGRTESETEKSIKMVALMTVFSMIAEGPTGIVYAITSFFEGFMHVSDSRERLDEILVNLANNIKRKIILFEVVQAPGGNSAFSTNPRVTHSNAVVD